MPMCQLAALNTAQLIGTLAYWHINQLLKLARKVETNFLKINLSHLQHVV